MKDNLLQGNSGNAEHFRSFGDGEETSFVLGNAEQRGESLVSPVHSAITSASGIVVNKLA